MQDTSYRYTNTSFLDRLDITTIRVIHGHGGTNSVGFNFILSLTLTTVTDKFSSPAGHLLG